MTGAGPVGLLAAMMGVQRNYEVYVLDRATDGPKPQLVRDLGALYLTGTIDERHRARARHHHRMHRRAVADRRRCSAARRRAGSSACSASAASTRSTFDFGQFNKTMVLNNDVVFGSVNANRRHYELAAKALADADPAWLDRLISRRVPLSNWQEALENRPGRHQSRHRFHHC